MILSIASDEEGRLGVSFNLYDSRGRPVAESDGTSNYPAGIRVHSEEGELLLDLPAKTGENIHYRLYNRKGELLTSSDGLSTRIGPCLRMESRPRNGAPRGSSQPRTA